VAAANTAKITVLGLQKTGNSEKQAVFGVFGLILPVLVRFGPISGNLRVHSRSFAVQPSSLKNCPFTHFRNREITHFQLVFLLVFLFASRRVVF
jgi:hypothetical protein